MLTGVVNISFQLDHKVVLIEDFEILLSNGALTTFHKGSTRGHYIVSIQQADGQFNMIRMKVKDPSVTVAERLEGGFSI